MPKHHAAQFLIALAASAAVSGTVYAQTDIPTNDIQKLKDALYDPAAKTDQRDQAAQRLLSRPDPAARDVIRVALTEQGQPNIQLAAARALANAPSADPALITPLFALLNSANDGLISASARALSAYKTDPTVLDRLITRATTGEEKVRVAAIRAVGTFVDKRAAAALVPLTDPVSQPIRISAEASAALSYLSGLPKTNTAGWQAWWATNNAKSDAQFQADLANIRSARYDQARARIIDMEDEISRTLADVYQKTPRDQQTDVLVRFLRSPEPAVRAAGCQIAQQVAESGLTPQPVKEQLRQLVGDASPTVRRGAALALATINDSGAVEVLLTQLNQETDTSVRAAIADALRPTRDPRAVQTLLKLLDDPSVDTAQTAAESLGELTLNLHDTDPAQAEKVADSIIKVLNTRTSAQNNVELRNSLVQALGSLQSRVGKTVLVKMLNAPAEDPRVRRSLLLAAGSYHDPDFGGAIAAWLGDPNHDVRLAAVRAIGESANSFGDFEQSLQNLIDPAKEKETDVRDAAWAVLTGLFKTATPEQLGAWEVKLKEDPTKLLAVLTEERNRAKAANEYAKVVDRDRQIGEVCFQLKQFADAVKAYREASTVIQEHNLPNGTFLSEGLTDALLRNRDYPQAVQYIQDQIAQDKSSEYNLAPKIKIEADRLINVDKNPDAANQLIDLALKMNPGLARVYTDQLQDLQAQVKARNNQRNQTPYPPADAVQNAMLMKPLGVS